jgi:LmbE family N-acetylglucosaminyl deacetylase
MCSLHNKSNCMEKKIQKVSNVFERILAIGAHPDDIELGCFGTLSEFKKKGSEVIFFVATFGGVGGDKQKRKSEALESAGILGANVVFGDLPDTEISEGPLTIRLIEDLILKFRPTAVFVHSSVDSHQDHRNISKAAISASRFVPAVFFYQTPSSTRYFNPNFFVDITDHMGDKIKAVKVHESQGKNVYMADRAVMGLAEFLGLQIYQGGRYFEGFEVYQIII